MFYTIKIKKFNYCTILIYYFPYVQFVQNNNPKTIFKTFVVKALQFLIQCKTYHLENIIRSFKYSTGWWIRWIWDEITEMKKLKTEIWNNPRPGLKKYILNDEFKFNLKHILKNTKTENLFYGINLKTII